MCIRDSDIADRHATARLEHAHELAKHRVLVGGEIDHTVATVSYTHLTLPTSDLV